MKSLVIYGAGGHGKVCADIARLNGYKNIVFLDDNKEIKTIDEYQVFHNEEDLPKNNEYDYFNAIGTNHTRENVTNKINKTLITLIHPTATIGENVIIGEGSVLMANTVVNPGTKIGKGVIVNTYASIDHDNVIEDYAHISVNSHLAGTVHIGKRVFAGIGSNFVNNITICDDVTIGAGATVINDINESGTYVGTPAKKINK